MKKVMTLILIFSSILALFGCGKSDTYEIKITVPAGSETAFCYSDAEIAATSNKITISSGEGLGDTEVILEPVDDFITAGYVATYMSPGMPVEFDATEGIWFKIGVSIQNDTDTDKTVSVNVKGVEVRIE